MAASRRLYEDVADSVKLLYESAKRHGPTAYLDGYAHGIEAMVDSLCHDFKQDNIHFNKEKFLQACGMPTH
jgi:hypothetical protein